MFCYILGEVAVVVDEFFYSVSICTVAVYYTLNSICTTVCFSLKKTAVQCFLECCMHSSLFFYKNTALWYILECYMHGSLFFSENTAVYYILECYMHGSSIQFVVFKPLSYFFEGKIGFDNRPRLQGLQC